MFVGTINSSIVHPREIFKEAYLLLFLFVVTMKVRIANSREGIMSIRKSFICRSYRVFFERNYFCKKTIIVNKITASLDLMKKKHNSVFIIMDKDNIDKDAFDNLKRCLKKTKLRYYIFNNIKDFSKTYDKALKLYKDNSCSCLIGFGSSLALDYAYKFSSLIKYRDYFITIPVTFELNNSLYRSNEDVIVLKGKLTKNISKNEMSINIINNLYFLLLSKK